MKVLFVCYPQVGLNKGGMYVQIMETAKALEHLGVEIIFHDQMQNQLPDIDVCHIFSTHPAVHGYMQSAIDAGVPTVWSTVFNEFAKPLWVQRVQVALSAQLPGFYTSWKTFRPLAEKCSRIISLNVDEKRRLEALFPQVKSKLSIIPNGININFSSATPVLFREHVGFRSDDRYVLNVAIFCKRKNQLNLIRAAKGMRWKLVLVGPFDDSAYSKQCLREAAELDNVTITGAFPYGSELLHSAYSGADVFCLPSYSEVQPLTLIEAAASGCRLVASYQTPIMPCLEGHVLQVPPDDVEALRANIDKALLSSSTARPEILKQPSWRDVALKIRTVYEHALIQKSNAG